MSEFKSEFKSEFNRNDSSNESRKESLNDSPYIPTDNFTCTNVESLTGVGQFTVNINSKPEANWTKLDFSRSIDENVGKFSIAGTLSAKDSKIQAGDLCDIFYGSSKKKVFTGVIDKINITSSRQGAVITYSGRDVICDAIDSSVPDNVKNRKGDMSLKSYAELLLNSLGLTNKVIDTTKDQAGTKVVKQQKTVEPGQKVMDTIAKFAAKQQVWLVANENSDLEIMRAGELTLNTGYYYLTNGKGKNNVIDSTLNIDTAQLYNKIKVRGKGSVAFEINAEAETVVELVDIQGSADDSNGRKSRYLEIATNDTLTPTEAKQRAMDEVNMRKAKSLDYTITTNFFNTRDGFIRVGGIVDVDDDIMYVSGKMIIKSFYVSYSKSDGTRVDIDLTAPEAYSIVDIDIRQQKTAKHSKHIKDFK